MEGGNPRYEDLESQDGLRYSLSSGNVVLADCIVDDDNGNLQQTKHGDASAPESGTAPSSKAGDSSGQGGQPQDGQGPSEVPKDSSSSGSGDGSGRNGGENNPDGRVYNQNQPPESREEYLHIVLLDKSYGKKQVGVDITNSKTTCEVFLELNDVYRKHRGSCRALTSVKNLRLTKVYNSLPMLLAEYDSNMRFY